VATEVILPRVDMDMTEGKIAFWYVKNGDVVTKGQTLFDIETDKATMEVEATANGVIDSIDGEIGVMMPVGQVVAWIRAPGEAAVDPPPTAPSAHVSNAVAAPMGSDPGSATAASAAATTAASTNTTGAAPQPHGVAFLRATPLARNLARTRGVDLNGLTGSGPRGRVVAGDLPATGAGPGSKASARLHLHWWQRGSPSPLLLLHGFGADHASWRPLVQQLPPDQPVFGIDLPNHGKSEMQTVKSVKALANAVLERLDQEGIAGCHLLGHSMGGAVAMAISAARPERVLSLTLLAPAGLGPEINGEFIDGLTGAESEAVLKVTLAKLFGDPAALTPSFVAIAFQQLQVPGRQAALAEMAGHLMPSGVQAEDLGAALETAKAPIKVIWGLADQIIPHLHSRGLPGQVALHLLPAVGHLPQIEAAPLVAKLVSQQVRAGTDR